MPKPRTGTYLHRPDENRWRGAVTVDGGRRVWVSGRTEDEVRAGMLEVDPDAAPRASTPRRPTLGVQMVRAMLERGKRLGWSDERLSRVIVRSLTPKRVHYGISGPCHYCGDEMANTVDHVIPLSRGGPDTLPNVVSCCASCNMSKRGLTVQEWRAI